MDTLKAMKLYCHIVDSGQLSIAAEQLNLSKGAVSKHLSAKVRAFVDMAVEHFQPPAGAVNDWDKDLPL